MRFRKTLLAMVALVACVTVSAEVQGDFCDGYKDGYRQGYSQVAGAGPAPLSPVCPEKPVRKDDPNHAEYDRGFQRGLKDGMRDGSR